ncbi:low molecular weight phosphotyrosine protein phosphatase [Streptococcus mitis]|nr:low molecular weight phosphotyrosine protein phosphatase [Streptococcus mitis]
MAEFVMKSMTDNYEIQSRATSSWEHGNPIHKGTQGVFQQYQIPYDKNKTSLQISKKDFEDFDYIIGMDASNVSDLRQMCPVDCQDKIYSFASESVPDPWYTGDFEETYRRVQEGCQAWLERLEKESEGGKS